MKKILLAIIGLLMFRSGAETVALTPIPFNETDLSRPLNLPQSISSAEYFRVSIGTVPASAQVVVSLGTDANCDGILDAEEVETTLDSDETTGLRLPNGTLPHWDTIRVTLRGAAESVTVKAGVTAPALKIMLY